MTKWMKAHVPAETVDRTEDMAIERFWEQFMLADVPASAALFATKPDEVGAVDLYLSPAASNWSSAVAPDLNWRAVTAPPRSEAYLLAGSSSARDELAEDACSDGPCQFR